MIKKPNIVFILADQWRKQATGFNGDPNVKTPNLDNLAKESINLVNAISGCPVCTPYRASFLTGQYPLTHGLFTNDVPLNPETPGLGDAFKSGGYETAYIGKWHVDGNGRKSFIPKERRKGFDYWKVLECTHQYNNSPYYDGDCEELKYWDGYDAIAQTEDACNYIKDYDKDNPFIMVLSYGPPHDQNVVPPEKDDWYFGAPEKYRKMYDADKLEVRPNLDEKELDARKKLEGYYAHCTALDDCIGDVLNTIKDKGIEDDTIFVFTSDHGDMLGSHGKGQKRFPWEESIAVPFLLRYPQKFGKNSIKSETLIGAADIMPTLLGLAKIAIPETVEGNDLTPRLSMPKTDDFDAILIASYASEGYYAASGGRDYRGVRTKKYTYTRDLNGPWLLFDNEKDPYQMNNIINSAEYAGVQDGLENILSTKLIEQNDDFLSTDEKMKKPNILLLFTDMQRADTIHALGNPVIKTPNLDRLVKEGTAFTNCYSPSPVCIPARCSMQYGLYPHNSGCADNGDWMQDNEKSFPAILADNGYKTHAVGKLHYEPDSLVPQDGQDALRGFQSRDSQEECKSDPINDNYCKYLKDNNYDFIEPHGYRGEMYYIPQVSTLPAEAHPTQWIGDRSIDFIDKENKSDKPWCLMSSFIHPHPPFAPPKPWHKLYRAPMMPLPKVPQDNDALLTHTNRVQNRYKYRDQGIDNNLMRNMKAFYYATISFVDYQVGRILDQLEKSGELENTIIIFSSDHGEFLGDYNCFGKRSMHDASSKVPLIIRYPEKFAKDTICKTPASLIDIMPTMLSTANIDEKEFNIDGVDLAKIADGSNDRKSILSQHLLWNNKEQGQYMIATENHKYFYSSTDDKEFLFDKTTDPDELRNAANNPFYTDIQKELKNELINSLNGTKLSHAITDNEWTKFPKAELEDTPDSHLIIQDDRGSVVKIEGYNSI